MLRVECRPNQKSNVGIVSPRYYTLVAEYKISATLLTIIFRPSYRAVWLRIKSNFSYPSDHHIMYRDVVHGRLFLSCLSLFKPLQYSSCIMSVMMMTYTIRPSNLLRDEWIMGPSHPLWKWWIHFRYQHMWIQFQCLVERELVCVCWCDNEQENETSLIGCQKGDMESSSVRLIQKWPRMLSSWGSLAFSEPNDEMESHRRLVGWLVAVVSKRCRGCCCCFKKRKSELTICHQEVEWWIMQHDEILVWEISNSLLPYCTIILNVSHPENLRPQAILRYSSK